MAKVTDMVLVWYDEVTGQQELMKCPVTVDREGEFRVRVQDAEFMDYILSVAEEKSYSTARLSADVRAKQFRINGEDRWYVMSKNLSAVKLFLKLKMAEFISPEIQTSIVICIQQPARWGLWTDKTHSVAHVLHDFIPSDAKTVRVGVGSYFSSNTVSLSAAVMLKRIITRNGKSKVDYVAVTDDKTLSGLGHFGKRLAVFGRTWSRDRAFELIVCPYEEAFADELFCQIVEIGQTNLRVFDYLEALKQATGVETLR